MFTSANYEITTSRADTWALAKHFSSPNKMQTPIEDDESKASGGGDTTTTASHSTIVSFDTDDSIGGAGPDVSDRSRAMKRETSRVSEVLDPGMASKPFQFVSGMVASNNKSKNPFRKKSGILNVISEQSTKRRLVSKTGEFNVHTNAMASKRHRLLRDFFISFLDMSWMMIFLIFAASFFVSWLLFAIIWYLIALNHGDFDNLDNEDHVPCVAATVDFTSAYLFSIETQHTIGYRGR